MKRLIGGLVTVVLAVGYLTLLVRFQQHCEQTGKVVCK